MKQDKYLFIKGSYVVSMDEKDHIYDNTVVVVKNDKIDFIGTEEETKEKYNKCEGEWIENENGVILPGLVTPHTHLFQSLMKGIGCHYNLDDWYTKIILPMSMKMNKDDCYNAGMLNMCEMIRTGTTCFADSHYIVQDDENIVGMVDALRDSGMRGIICRATTNIKYFPETPDQLIEDAETAIKKSEDCIQKYHDTENGRIRIGVEPLAVTDCSKEAISGLYELAEKHDTLFQIHAAETFGEFNYMKNVANMGVMEYLDSLHALGDRTLIIHGVWMSSNEKMLLKQRKVNFVTNPTSNMILADGIAPVLDLRALGVNVGIGVDGAASNNNQDMFEAMKFCALLQRVAALDASVLSAYDVLKMGTIIGAKCLRLDKEIGSLEVGKKADIIIVDTDSMHVTPNIEKIVNTVFSGNGRDVDTTIVDGKVLMKNKKFVNLDVKDVIKKANQSARKLYREVG